jgi:hypothetical protein
MTATEVRPVSDGARLSPYRVLASDARADEGSGGPLMLLFALEFATLTLVACATSDTPLASLLSAVWCVGILGAARSAGEEGAAPRSPQHPGTGDAFAPHVYGG